MANINAEIAKSARKLASLLRKRDELHNSSAFHDDAHYHVLGVLDGAATNHQRFRSYVAQAIHNLRGQFDLKYWPKISEFVEELALDAGRAKVVPSDPITAVACESLRNSRADFVKALLVAINENSIANGGSIPDDFKMSDATVASLINCALDIEVSEIVDESYVKRFRQRERDRA